MQSGEREDTGEYTAWRGALQGRGAVQPIILPCSLCFVLINLLRLECDAGSAVAATAAAALPALFMQSMQKQKKKIIHNKKKNPA